MNILNGPCASVVISTRNRPNSLRRCLLALLYGELAPSEVVVVDQGTPAVDAELKTAFDDRQIPLRHILTEDIGVSVGRNIGIRSSSCDLLAFTDDDCVPHASWLMSLAQACCKPQISGVTGRVLPLASEQPNLVPSSSRTSVQAQYFQGGHFHAPWEVGTGGNMLFRRDAVEQVGGFDTTLGPGAIGRAAEDIDFIYRVLGAGHAVAYEPRAIVYHEMKTPQDRLRSRFYYGYGMGAFVASQVRKGDPHVLSLLWSYLRLQLMQFVSALRPVQVRRMLELIVTVGAFVWGISRHSVKTRGGQFDR